MLTCFRRLDCLHRARAHKVSARTAEGQVNIADGELRCSCDLGRQQSEGALLGLATATQSGLPSPHQRQKYARDAERSEDESVGRTQGNQQKPTAQLSRSLEGVEGYDNELGAGSCKFRKFRIYPGSVQASKEFKFKLDKAAGLRELSQGKTHSGSDDFKQCLGNDSREHVANKACCELRASQLELSESHRCTERAGFGGSGREQELVKLSEAANGEAQSREHSPEQLFGSFKIHLHDGSVRNNDESSSETQTDRVEASRTLLPQKPDSPRNRKTDQAFRRSDH